MKKRSDFLPYAKPFCTQTELEYVSDAIRSGWWSTGEKAKEFERAVAERTGANYAIAVNSCTAALQLALESVGVQNGKEVITTPMTFCSTIHSIIHAGGIPVLCDIDPVTGLMDVTAVEQHITQNTAAILPVHYAGQCCDMDPLIEIAEHYKIKVVEDAAHGFGSSYKGKQVGTLGDATCFSFYATKNLSTGEGGMITTNCAEICQRATTLSLHGMDKNAYLRYAKANSWGYDVTAIGYKDNMGDITASLGLAQLTHFDTMQKQRDTLAKKYGEELSHIKGIEPLPILPYGTHNHHLYVVSLTQEYPLDRNQLIRTLAEEYKIGCSVHFIPVYQFSCYRDYWDNAVHNLPKTEQFFQGILSLPLYPDMKIEDVKYVADAIREIAGQHEE